MVPRWPLSFAGRDRYARVQLQSDIGYSESAIAIIRATNAANARREREKRCPRDLARNTCLLRLLKPSARLP